MKITLDKYYELQENPSSEKEYKEALKQLSNETTSREFFTVEGRICPKRNELHENIIKKYLNRYKPLEGARPTLHFITGSIGSGKTSVKDTVIKSAESYIFINLDAIKNKLKEYQILKKINPRQAAAFLQAESARIAGKLFKKSIQKKLNIIYEKNLVRGKNNKLQVIEDLKRAFDNDYVVLIYVVFVDSYDTAQERVDKRAERIRRYVPKERVRDTFDNLFPHLGEVVETGYVDVIRFFDNNIDHRPDKLPMIPIGYFIANRYLKWLSGFGDRWRDFKTYKIKTGSLSIWKSSWKSLGDGSKESFQKAFPFVN